VLSAAGGERVGGQKKPPCYYASGKDEARADVRSERGGLVADCESALRNLGYSPAQARGAARRAANEDSEVATIQALLTSALRWLRPGVERRA
jgi:Holliday junction resolvasome RuvABC DNA-binding subunit